MKNFLLGVLAVLFVGGIGFSAYKLGQKSSVSDIHPALTIQPTTASLSPSVTGGQKVGSDRDAHGCIPSAGYTWCEAKAKCLRTFEEGCPGPEDTGLIKQALFAKHNWTDTDNLTVKVSTNDGNYASGTVSGQGGGGYFYAAKVNGVWKIVADGNGSIMCADLVKYPDYPVSLIPECYDQATAKIIKR